MKREDPSTMIPISDDNPVRHPPIINGVLIAACVAAFLWELWAGIDAAVAAWGFVPAAPWSTHVVLTLVTAMFLHGGWLHIAFSMLYLWIFGNNVEDAMGHWRYALFYLACGLAAVLTFALMDPGSLLPMVGASGAISGVQAAYVLLYPRAKVTVAVPLGIIFYPLKVSAVWVVGLWFVLLLFNTWIAGAGQPGTAWWSHLGGFAAGLLLTPLFKSRDVPLFGQPPAQTGL